MAATFRNVLYIKYLSDNEQYYMLPVKVCKCDCGKQCDVRFYHLPHTNKRKSYFSDLSATWHTHCQGPDVERLFYLQGQLLGTWRSSVSCHLKRSDLKAQVLWRRNHVQIQGWGCENVRTSRIAGSNKFIRNTMTALIRVSKLKYNVATCISFRICTLYKNIYTQKRTCR